jgi:hypothetical protein
MTDASKKCKQLCKTKQLQGLGYSQDSFKMFASFTSLKKQTIPEYKAGLQKRFSGVIFMVYYVLIFKIRGEHRELCPPAFLF